MAKAGFKVFDSDMHVLEPPDLWQRYIEPEYKEHAPIGLTSKNLRELRMTHSDGRPWGHNPSRDKNRPPDGGKNFERTQLVYQYYSDHGWSSKVQLEAMDVEGIDVAVLYPTRGLIALAEPDMEPRLAAAIARAYNNWMYDFCSEDPQRLFGAAMISPYDINEAVKEARRCSKELGFKAAFIRANVFNGKNWFDEYYDPLWSTFEELDLPLGFHEATRSGVNNPGERFEPNFMLRRVYSQPLEQMMALGSFCAGGVLARHPKLRVAFLEGNCSWLPWVLWRLDEAVELDGDVWTKGLTMAPSEYFKRQCIVSVEPDEHIARSVIDQMGCDHLVFSTDYPHVDSRFPYAIDTFLKLPWSDEEKRKILWDNCASYYGFHLG